MDLFSTEHLKKLTEINNCQCISIYMPTQRIATESQQNRIRFKNLLRQAEEELEDQGMGKTELSQLLDPAYRLLEDGHFFRDQADGLACFISREKFEFHRVPIQFKELAVTADRFHLKPLIQLLTGDGRFFILALSQNNIRLFECTRDSIAETQVEGIPESMKEALKYDEPLRQMQFHTGTGSGGGKRAAVFHGQGVGADEAKENILEFFRKVNKGVSDFLQSEKGPLVLAGVDYLFPIYREANSYQNLLEEGIRGNPEDVSVDELHQKAWEIVKPLFEKDRQSAAEKFHELSGTGKTDIAIETIIPAAAYGRIETLFVEVGVQVRGHFDPAKSEVIIDPEAEKGADLLDFAAIQTLLQSGTVYAVTHDEIPDDSPIAAIYRF